MNLELLRHHIKNFIDQSRKYPERFDADFKQRQEITDYYRQFTRHRILAMTSEDIFEYISKLWAMQIWGNKHYAVDKILSDNGLQEFRKHLAELIWGETDIAERWDSFRSCVKGMGPAMISEILCKTSPNEYMLWNRRAYVALDFLGVGDLPKYDYQFNGRMYKYLCGICKEIAKELEDADFQESSLLAVDYFIWDELQVEDNLSNIHKKDHRSISEKISESPEEASFVHDEIRDKLRDIGQWLGFIAKTEQKVSDGARVDTIWEATIGNMGRVIYIFEVQTKGSIDSLMLNLLKSLNNPAVQGVVAVSDRAQLDRIKKHAQDVKDLKDKLKYWDCETVLKVHEGLEFVNSSINDLGLVPTGFY